MTEYQCDAKFLACPLPILKAQKILKQMTKGDRLMVLVSDVEQIEEFKFFCEQGENTYIFSEKQDEKVQNHDVWQVLIEK